MYRLIVLLFLVLSVCADELALAVTENDPSTLVEGVSVITGDLYSFEEDYVVQGAEPIRLRRSFISREGEFKSYQHLTAAFGCTANCFFVNEHNGTTLCYFKDLQNHIHPEIGEHFYGKEKKYWKSLRYNAHDFTQEAKGVSNTSSGKISAQTHLKNQYIIFDPNVDARGESFTLYASDGTKRRYVNLAGQTPRKSFPFEGTYSIYGYKLVSETLPNGHIIHYHWDSKNRVDRIYTTNAALNKTFAQVNIPVKQSQTEVTLAGSDERSVTYKAHPTEVKDLFVQCDVISPELPDQHFDWSMKPRIFGSEQKKKPYLQHLSLPKHRAMQIGYTDVEDPVARQLKTEECLRDVRKKIKEIKPKAKKKPNKYEQELGLLRDEEARLLKYGVENEGLREGYLVKTISSPVGKEATFITTHSFFYDKPNKNSYVLDVNNNKTSYFWNDDYRLTRVNRFVGTDKLHSSDSFVWEKTNLRCKFFFDQHSQPIFSRTYLYDDRGNVREETFYGNLSGKGIALAVGSDGFPGENGVEKLTKKFSYSEDGRNLLLKQEESGTGLVIKYSYRNDCHLIETKSICDGGEMKIHHKYEYDDHILCLETMDDGISRIQKKITSRQKGPYIGLPETIEERYGDGTLLRRIVLQYGRGGTVKQKDIYDANGKFRYSLKMDYDDKGRLKSETNAIGQRATYHYDEVGNREYAKDFSGRLEIFYEYDFSNRLIKKEEKEDDGVHRIYRYDYDTKHNLISETDPYGNETIYIPDPFGHRKEIHLPPIPNEQGRLVPSDSTHKYDSAGNEIEKKDPEGNITQTSYNAYGKPVLIIHPDGATEKYTYYLNGNLNTYVDPKGVETSYEYDYLGRVLKKTTSFAEETFKYSGQYLIEKTDAEKNKTTYGYDRAGRKISEECAGEETFYTYDELARLHTTQKGDLVTITEYDDLDRVVEERNETISKQVLRKVKYEYDSAGNRKTIIRSIVGKEEREEFKYDSVNRLIEKKDAVGSIETYEYDPKVNRIVHTDSMGLQTIETYNAQNRIATIAKKKEKTLSFQEKYYNKNGKLTLQIDTINAPDGSQRQVQTRWDYNNRSLLKTLVEADGTLNPKITLYTYTPRSELATVAKPNGVILIYRYNDLGYLESLTSSDGTVSHQMKYNRLGYLKESGPLVRKTDPCGRILLETFPHGHSIQNTYDQQGRRVKCAIPAADCSITYAYDPVNLKKVSRKKLDDTVLYSHTYTSHDLSGNLLQQELILNSGTVRFSIDPLSRTTAIASPQFSHEVLEFDPVGNIAKMRIGVDETAYTYDDLYQLTSESGLFAHTYAFDSLYNRLQKDDKHFKINALNQVPALFQYDKNGNPTQCDGTTYAYDALDRLIRIETHDFIQTFTYDPLHRCLSKTVIQGGIQETTYFLHDGQNEIGAFDENLDPIELRILGSTPHAEIGAAIAIEINGKVHVPVHDLQGNLAVLQPVGGEGTVYRYSAFGEEKITGEAVSPWRFSSKRTDTETGLVNFGRRYYLPTFGRWLTPDPAGFIDGMNLYAYVHNDPLTHFDEYGLIMDARGYNTVQQITRFPWEGERPWSTASHYARNFASRTAHDSFDRFWAPLQRDFDRCANLFSYNSQRTEQRIWDGKQGIDRFFGTNIANADRARSNFRQSSGMEFAEVGIPFGPGGMFSGASRVATVAGKAFQNAGALSPVTKLSLNAQRYANPHSIRFSQPTISQNFSKGGDLNNMITALRSGKMKVTNVPIIRVVEYEGKTFTLDNRRLAAFQNAGVREIPIQRVSLHDPNIFDEFFDKYNPVNNGLNTVVIPKAKFREETVKSLREYGKIN